MAGHSKWSTIKHKKGAADKARGKLFGKLIRQVEVAAREGGGDPDMNPSLRTMVQKARDNSVPIDTIDRAIKRGTGELEGVNYESITYEGYAPNGVALLVEVLTDNRNRTGAEIKTIFNRSGGSLAEPGAVAWQFERRGLITVPSTVEEDDVMLVALDAGADDIVADGDVWDISCAPGSLSDIRSALDEAGITVESADTAMVSSTLVALDSETAAAAVLKVVEALDDHDDVQAVHGNFDIPTEILESIEL